MVVRYCLLHRRFPNSFKKNFFDYYNNVFPDGWDCFILDRPPLIKTRLKKNITYVNMYNDPIYSRKVTKKDIKTEERWLGTPFNTIISMEDSYYKKCFTPIQRKKENIVRHIRFFRNFFHQNKINFCFGGRPNEIVSIVYYLVMKRLKIKHWDAIEPVRGPSEPNTFNVIVDGKPFFIHSQLPSKIELFNFVESKRKLIIAKNYQLDSEEVRRARINFSFSLKNLIIKIKQLKRIYKHKCSWESHFEIRGYSALYLQKFIRGLMNTFLSRFLFTKEITGSFFYFPLHYTRDSSMTFGEPFADQMDLVKKVARALPHHTKLFVKPHPYYFGSDFSFSDYLKLKRIPNVNLISSGLNSTLLVKRCLGVITINSTTGYEAFFLNKPVISFGHDFYIYKNACVKVRDFNELPEILLNVVNRPFDLFDNSDRAELIYLYSNNSFELDKNLTKLIGDKGNNYRLSHRDYKKIKEIHLKIHKNIVSKNIN